jgi:hypothetical protein
MAQHSKSGLAIRERQKRQKKEDKRVYTVRDIASQFPSKDLQRMAVDS